MLVLSSRETEENYTPAQMFVEFQMLSSFAIRYHEKYSTPTDVAAFFELFKIRPIFLLKCRLVEYLLMVVNFLYDCFLINFHFPHEAF